MHRAGVVTGVVLALYFSFCSWSSHQMETCTMGDTDGYMVAVIFGGPLVLAACALLWRARRVPGAASYIGATLVILTTGALLLLDLIPWVTSTTLAGNHPCGSDYNSYLAYLGPVRFYLPVIHASLAALPLVVASLALATLARRSA